VAVPTLYAASFSPWTERARWALDHQAVPYRQVEHTILLGEPLLRLRTGRLRGGLSIPLLVDGDVKLFDGVDIARWADARGSRAKLFPAGAEKDLGHWVRRATDLMEAGRSLLLPRLLADRAARLEALPAWVPGPLRGLMDPMAVLGTRWVRRKYRDLERHPAAASSTIRGVLGEARARLAAAPFVLDAGFSFADVALAVALQVVRPVEHPAMPLGAAYRAAWTVAPIAGEFPEVLAWRDRLYAERRPPSSAV
jgi:glutathione S-transferase